MREVIKGEIGKNFGRYVGWVRKDGVAKANEHQQEYEQRLENYRLEIKDIRNKHHQLKRKEELLYREVRNCNKVAKLLEKMVALKIKEAGDKGSERIVKPKLMGMARVKKRIEGKGVEPRQE